MAHHVKVEVLVWGSRSSDVTRDCSVKGVRASICQMTHVSEAVFFCFSHWNNFSMLIQNLFFDGKWFGFKFSTPQMRCVNCGRPPVQQKVLHSEGVLCPTLRMITYSLAFMSFQQDKLTFFHVLSKSRIFCIHFKIWLDEIFSTEEHLIKIWDCTDKIKWKE